MRLRLIEIRNPYNGFNEGFMFLQPFLLLDQPIDTSLDQRRFDFHTLRAVKQIEYPKNSYVDSTRWCTRSTDSSTLRPDPVFVKGRTGSVVLRLDHLTIMEPILA